MQPLYRSSKQIVSGVITPRTQCISRKLVCDFSPVWFCVACRTSRHAVFAVMSYLFVVPRVHSWRLSVTSGAWSGNSRSQQSSWWPNLKSETG